MNRKKLEAELITLGYNETERVEMLIQLDEIVKFVEFMKEKYEITEQETEKMYEMFVNSKEKESEERLLEGVDEKMDDETVVKIMTQSVIDTAIEYMYEYAKIHGYDRLDEYKKASTIYINELLRDQIVKAMNSMI